MSDKPPAAAEGADPPRTVECEVRPERELGDITGPWIHQEVTSGWWESMQFQTMFEQIRFLFLAMNKIQTTALASRVRGSQTLVPTCT